MTAFGAFNDGLGWGVFIFLVILGVLLIRSKR